MSLGVKWFQTESEKRKQIKGEIEKYLKQPSEYRRISPFVKDITLPYRLVVPIKVKESLVESYEPFYKNRMFWVALSAIVMMVFVYPRMK